MNKIKKNLKNSVNAEIKTSSMADIAFLLIVFFMITTVIAINKGVILTLPEEKKTDGPATHGILIEIKRNNEILLDGRHSSLDAIKDYCGEKLSKNPNKPVIIRCYPDENYQRFIDVLDELKQLELDLYAEYNKDKPVEKRKRIKIRIPLLHQWDVQ